VPAPGISLDCLTLLDQPAPELVRIAGRTGYAMVSLWVQEPILPFGALASPSDESTLLRTLAETGVGVGNLEVFNLASDHPIDAFEPALAFGARLGAKTATAIDYGDRSTAEIAERLAGFCRLAASYGLGVNVEPISMSRTATVRDAATLIRAAGSPDCGIVLDMLHFVRTGSSLADLAALEEETIRYVQLCDGPIPVDEDHFAVEATEERLDPGEGDFPIAAVLERLPERVQLAVEVPAFRRRRALGIGAERHAALAMEAALKLLARARTG